MEAFTTHTGVVLPLDRANVDTDALIPKQYLKSISRTGFGPALFSDWRYLADGSDNPEFVQNMPIFKGASILLARNNFGCGSSREHAVWAVKQDGFRAIIAPCIETDGEVIPAFADIFSNNSTKNGLLTIELSEGEVDELFSFVESNPGAELTIDLASQEVRMGDSKVYSFKIAPEVKEMFLLGLDPIDLTLKLEGDITEFETKHDTQLPV